MKKIMIVIASLLITVAAYGQNGRSYVGGGINYGTDIEAVGIGVKYGYGLTSHIYIEPNFNYFLKKDYNMWDINLDFQWRFYVADKFTLYPIVGISYAHCKFSGSGKFGSGSYTSEWKSNKIGGNFGAGVAYDITNSFFVNLDLKYRAMSNLGQGVFGIGVGYRF